VTNPAVCEGCADVRENGGSTCGDCGTFLALVVPPAGACIFGVFCQRHGFIHGAEAEELRQKIERLLSTEDGDVPTWAIRRVLEKVDARDSLAWMERRKADERADASEGPAAESGS
jgi:hypothetical protein